MTSITDGGVLLGTEFLAKLFEPFAMPLMFDHEQP